MSYSIVKVDKKSFKIDVESKYNNDPLEKVKKVIKENYPLLDYEVYFEDNKNKYAYTQFKSVIYSPIIFISTAFSLKESAVALIHEISHVIDFNNNYNIFSYGNKKEIEEYAHGINFQNIFKNIVDLCGFDMNFCEGFMNGTIDFNI